jgi:hypothetical protein
MMRRERAQHQQTVKNSICKSSRRQQRFGAGRYRSDIDRRSPQVVEGHCEFLHNSPKAPSRRLLQTADYKWDRTQRARRYRRVQ